MYAFFSVKLQSLANPTSVELWEFNSIMLENRSSSIKFHVMTRSFYFVTFFGKGWSKNSPGYKKGDFLWFSVWVLWLWFCGMIGLFFICDLSKHWFLSNSFAYASSAWFTPFNQLIPWSLQHNMNNTLSSSQRHFKLWFKYVEPEKKMVFLSQLPEKSTKQKDVQMDLLRWSQPFQPRSDLT